MDHRLLLAAAASALALAQGCATQAPSASRTPDTVATEAAEPGTPPVATAQFGPLPPVADPAGTSPPIAATLPADSAEQRRNPGN